MSLFNMSQALNGFATTKVTVRRPSVAGYTSAGVAAAPTYTEFLNVKTAFQNLRGDDLRHVPEGDRTSSWQKIWPQMVLQTGDRIVHLTRGTYVVQTIDDNREEGGFAAAFIRKLGDGES